MITTTDTGSTELKALGALTELSTQIKVNQDTSITRLHAKVWPFQRQILEQSRTTFRHVLRSGSFSELWLDGQRPSQWKQVFTAIQTITANDTTSLGPHNLMSSPSMNFITLPICQKSPGYVVVATTSRS